MKPVDIVAVLKKQNSDAFGTMPDKKVVRIVRDALAYVGAEVAAAKEGTVRVAGLGTFRVRNAPNEQGGQKNSMRKVLFVAAAGKPKAKK